MKWLGLAILIFAMGCGKHSSRQSGYRNGGTVNTGIKAEAPLEQLQVAIAQGDIEAVQAALKKGADINGVFENGHTPLIEAVIWNKIKVIEVLLKNGALVGTQDKTGKSAKDYAAENPEVLNVLFFEERRVENTKRIFEAVLQDDFSLVDDLLEEGVDPNVQDQDGNTPLHVAVLNSFEKVVRILVRFEGINFSLKNNKGETPLAMARRLELSRIEQLLIRGGAEE